MYSRPDLSVVADPNGMAIQKRATTIDETIVADADVPSAVTTETRLDLR
jgi:hypothetical protein